MSRERSPATGRMFGVKRVITAWEVSRATLYRQRSPKETRGRRGPKPLISDRGLLSLIEEDFASSFFRGDEKCMLDCVARGAVRVSNGYFD